MGVITLPFILKHFSLLIFNYRTSTPGGRVVLSFLVINILGSNLCLELHLLPIEGND